MTVSALPTSRLTHLKQLEAEAIHIMREVVAQFERPVMLYSISEFLRSVASGAQGVPPGPDPVPSTPCGHHVEVPRDDRVPRSDRQGTRHRDDRAHESRGQGTGHQPVRSRVEELHRRHEDPGAQAGAHCWALRRGLRRCSTRREAESEGRVFSFRDKFHRWDPKNQRPELWSLYNGRVNKGESIRVFPISNWTELDIWQYIHLENIDIVPLYFSAPRPVVTRDGVTIMVDDDRFQFEPGEEAEEKWVRFRTLGCYPLSGGVESTATTLPEIIQEMLLATRSEREGRVIDYDQSGSMEEKKREGYF